MSADAVPFMGKLHELPPTKVPPEPEKLPGDPVGAGWCYSCNKVRGQRIVTVCRKHYCLRCTKRHIDQCDTCSRQWYVDSRGEVQEFKQPSPEREDIFEDYTGPDNPAAHECPTCKSKGFPLSTLGADRCTFCDGTEGGNPPERRLTAAERLAASRAARRVAQ